MYQSSLDDNNVKVTLKNLAVFLPLFLFIILLLSLLKFDLLQKIITAAVVITVIQLMGYIYSRSNR